MVQFVFNFLLRYYVPIWRKYPSNVIAFRLYERHNFWGWAAIGGMCLPIYLAIIYGAGALYESTDIVAFAFISAIAGFAYFKLMAGIPASIIRHAILTIRERRHATRREPVLA